MLVVAFWSCRTFWPRYQGTYFSEIHLSPYPTVVVATRELSCSPDMAQNNLSVPSNRPTRPQATAGPRIESTKEKLIENGMLNLIYFADDEERDVDNKLVCLGGGRSSGAFAAYAVSNSITPRASLIPSASSPPLACFQLPRSPGVSVRSALPLLSARLLTHPVAFFLFS